MNEIEFNAGPQWHDHQVDFLHRLASLIVGVAYVSDQWAVNRQQEGHHWMLGVNGKWFVSEVDPLKPGRYVLAHDGGERKQMLNLKRTIIWLLALEPFNRKNTRQVNIEPASSDLKPQQ